MYARSQAELQPRRIITIADPASSKPVIDESEILAKLTKGTRSTTGSIDESPKSESKEEPAKESTPVVEKPSKKEQSVAKEEPATKVQKSAQKAPEPARVERAAEVKEAAPPKKAESEPPADRKTASESSANTNEEEPEEWQQVKTKRGKKPVRGTSATTPSSKKNHRTDKVAELDFQFDDELENGVPQPPAPRDRRNSHSELHDEMSDANIDQLIIVTQNPAKRQFDRTGDFTKRHERHQLLNEEMEHGLRRYEEELWCAEARRESPPNVSDRLWTRTHAVFRYPKSAP